MRNPQLKRAYSTDEYTPQMIQDLARCRKDPIYFMTGYIKIQHPTKGAIKFDMFDYQIRFVQTMHENRSVITLQPRQCGKTVTAAMYLLWYALFHDDVTMLIASKNQTHAMEIASRVKFAYEELPNWIKCGLVFYNQHKVEFDNGSRVICEATTDKTGRGGSFTKIYLDELAFISPRIQTKLWASLKPALSTGGSAIISSTPNGDTDLFANLWRGAMSGVNSFVPFTVHWREHPERGDEYWNEMVSDLGLLVTRQEVGCEFLSSDALLINSMKLAQLQSRAPLYQDMGFKFWIPQERIGGSGKTYLVGVDPSTGSGKDFSVIQVFEFPSLVQIAEWRSNSLDIPVLYSKVKWILNFLSRIVNRGRSDVLWTFERNGVGEAMCALYIVDEKQPEYADLYNDVEGKYGVFTSGKSKILACLQLKSLVEKTTNNLTINSEILLFELKNFVAKGGTYEGKLGVTDDAVMATINVIRLLKRLSDYNDEAFKRVNEYVDPESDSVDPYSDEPVPFAIL